jgi:hypothetical protein
MSEDLVTWLRAQLDEDEVGARAVKDRSEPWPGVWRADGDSAVRTHCGWVLTHGRQGSPLAPGFTKHVARWNPARALAEVEAKRRILGWVERAIAITEADGYNLFCEDLLRLLALPYADRDGYRKEWRP